jgi:hypothetical protein
MKVLHIIPSAFEYFDDIRAQAFEILEKENKLGVESDAITLEYGAVGRREKFEVATVAPSRKYLGQESIEKNSQAWQAYDIINLHCPFFGAAGKILDFLKFNPDKFFLITYHHDFVSPDFFGYFIKFYNYYYLPKLLNKAKVIVFFSNQRTESAVGIGMVKNESKVAVLGLFGENTDIHNDSIVQDMVMVYNNIVLK